jgi:hypothetical protein
MQQCFLIGLSILDANIFDKLTENSSVTRRRCTKTASSAFGDQSNPDIAPLYVHRNLWKHYEGGSKSKYCIIGNFRSQTSTWREVTGGGGELHQNLSVFTFVSASSPSDRIVLQHTRYPNQICLFRWTHCDRNSPTTGRQIQQLVSKQNKQVHVYNYSAKPVSKVCISFRHYGLIIINRKAIISIDLFPDLKPKRGPLYLKTQSVPRCKHFSSRL